MSGNAHLVITEGVSARQSLNDLVMAWARDSATGEPRYILELDAAHRGAKCGCECASCGKPLTAVNAAKTEFVRKPHFRHPEGAQRDECLVLTARAAALRQLQEDGWLDLPRRRMSARLAGLSGENHEAWVEEAPERRHISHVDYRDRATAVITFDDGRQLRVDLTGTPGSQDAVTPSGPPTPTIYLAIDDPELAALTPEELRRRARLVPDNLCWRAHWNDADLQIRAEAAARARARFYFDDEADGLDLPAGLDPALRRETVLHREVKRILAEVGRLIVPAVAVEVEVAGADGQVLRGRWDAEEEQLRLINVLLETRYGRLVPDIICEAFGADGQARYLPLLVEVTVTNRVDEDRLDRIRRTGEATLEIDLSLAGGRVNRDELSALVVEELAFKRWLFHPDSDSQRGALLARLSKQIADRQGELDARAKWLADRRTLTLARPVSDIAGEYLQAVIQMLDVADGEPATVHAAKERVADATDKLAMHGYPEAGDENLVGRGAILARLLSIVLGRPVGYRYDNLMGVLNAIRQTTGSRMSTLTVYFIALRLHPPRLAPAQQKWLEDWMAEVRQSIKIGQTVYLRDPSYDKILSLLFPEMAAGLSKPGGKLSPSTGIKWDHDRQVFVRPELPDRRRARFLETQPRSDKVNSGLLDTRPGDWFLKGRDLAKWKRANPEWARAWFKDDTD